MKHKLAVTAITTGLLTACVFAQSTGQATGIVDGVVFTVDANGGHAVVPHAKLSMDGPTHLEVESDGVGKFAFNKLRIRRQRRSAAVAKVVENRDPVTAAQQNSCHGAPNVTSTARYQNLHRLSTQSSQRTTTKV